MNQQRDSQGSCTTGQTPHFSIFNDEADISNLCLFEWYQCGYYREEGAKFPLPSEVLCRVLGPSSNAGNMMSQWCLNIHGKIVPSQTVRPLTEEERISPSERNKHQVFSGKFNAGNEECGIRS